MRTTFQLLIVTYCILLLLGCGNKEDPACSAGTEIMLSHASDSLDLKRLLESTANLSVAIPSSLSPCVESIRVLKQYNLNVPVEHSLIQLFPTTLNLTAANLTEGLGVSPENLQLDDEITLSFQILKKGENRFSQQDFTILMICQSDLAGTYQVTTTGESGWGGGGAFDEIFQEITISANTTHVYEISDITGGFYPKVWAGEPQPAELKDSCGVLIIPTFTDQFNDEFSAGGSVTEEGIITINWESSYGDKGTSTYVRK